MLNKWALVINICAFVLIAVVLILQFGEISAYFDGLGNLSHLFK